MNKVIQSKRVADWQRLYIARPCGKGKRTQNFTALARVGGKWELRLWKSSLINETNHNQTI